MTPDEAVPQEVTLIACGMFLWDYSATLWFELAFVRGKLKLRWPLIPYFLTRYITLGFAIGCLIFYMSRRPLNCDAISIGVNFLGKAAVVSASVNLIVRTVIIWSYRWYIALPLGVLITAEVALIGLGLRDRGSVATWNNELQSCIGTGGSQEHDLGLFAPYALSVDCITVILTVIGLRKFNPTSGFAAVLIRQGLGFFFLVLVFQTLVTAAVFTKDAGVLVPAASVSCAMIVPMVSCHLVRSTLGGSYSTSEPRAAPRWGSTTAGGYFQDGAQLTTPVEVWSSSSCRSTEVPSFYVSHPPQAANRPRIANP